MSAARDRPSTAPSGFPGPDVHIGIHPEDPVRETVAFARRVEALGFTGLWIADSQDLFRDCLVTLTAAALGTTSLRLTTGVVNPVLRHPAVLAGAAATLAEMATGRIGLGIGSGETSVQTAGLRPARLREMQEAIERIRAGLRDPWGRGPAAVPIALAATGPRALGLAGRVADSAYVKIGAAPQLLDWARRRIDDGAAERELADPCRLTLMVPVALGDTREAAIREIAGFAAASAAAVSAAVPRDAWPPSLREPIAEVAELVAAARASSAYASWLDDPSLVGTIPAAIIEHFAVVATDPAELAQRLTALAADTVVLPLLTGRRDDQLERIAEALATTATAGR